MIARMGVYPNNNKVANKHGRGFTRFRTAARVVIATRRMQFLVNKSKRAVKTAGRSYGSPADSSTPSTTRTDPASYRETRSPMGYISIHQPEVHRPTNAAAFGSDRDGDYVAGMRSSRGNVPRGERTSFNGVSDHHESSEYSNLTTGVPGRSTFSNNQSNGITGRDPSYDRTKHLSSSQQKKSSSPTRSQSRAISHRYRPPMSPPVRDQEGRWRNHLDHNENHEGLQQIPRDSSSRLRQRSPSPRRTSEDDRSLSGTTSSHNSNDGDHSLSLYIHRLESLQNRLAAASKGKRLQEHYTPSNK